ncbi:hypothetical protein I5M27_14410 [Adhaeribacter sp. BT258]|uniref:Phosphopeptide-binding protein n=1 Tax=Adhaeribacter terrigena TaxID=2793070 RepID=A0ABS1C457_9BACT|nr:hypothetical protein [Adhaeribacter terrigena]MBK0404185.1 hypothetical protein [Adhaeribacter terrigena]
MKKHYSLFLAGSFMLAFSACDTTKQTTNETTTTPNGTQTVAQQPANEVMEKNGLRVYSFDDSPKMAEAAIRLVEPVTGASLPSSAVNFQYEITNFKLTDMTGHDHSKEMANSMQGQHIHNIVDNEPYTAHYETKFTKDVKAGNHVVLSFLSRSYHESLKHKSAYDLRTFSIGKPKEANTFDLNAQHMFYSRPKGEYVGNDTKKVMLDFYLVNTDLSPEGNKVRATINGTEFMLNRWLPYTIEGLPMGENKIKLELLDNAGNVIPGPYNTVERTITLKAA